MNLPNKITISRFFAPPLFMAAMIYYNKVGSVVYYWLSLAVFILAAASDGLDGYFARTLNQRSRLGSILDPLADKMFLNCAIVILALGIKNLFQIPVWFVILIVSRDLLIVGGSILIRSFKGTIQVRPNRWGKTAAVLQMIVVIWILLHPNFPPVLLTRILLYLTAVFVIISGATYLRGGIRQLE